MRFDPTELAEVILVTPDPREDERGFLMRTYCEREFAAAGLGTRWVQQNHTFTNGRGSVRGLHLQAEPYREIKLVRCLSGAVFDVVVDMRLESGTFGRWTSRKLSGENRCALYIPEGFAHGFQCLTESCELLYLMSEFYQPASAKGFRWDDPAFNIAWPIPVVGLSERDREFPLINEDTQ